MRNSFLVNIILLVFINILIKPAYIFAVEIPVQNHVGNDIYGMYFTFLNLAYIFQLLSDMGLQNLTYSELPKDRSVFRQLLSNVISLRVILAFVFMALLAMAGYILGYWQLDSRLFLLVVMNVLFISTLQYVRANLSGLGYYFRDSMLSIVDKSLMLIVLLVLLHGPGRSEFTIYSFVLVQTFSLLAAIGVGMIMLQERVRWIRPQISQMRPLLRRAFPYGVLIALMFLYTRLDAIMIEKMLSNGLEEAGLYASAYRLYDAVAMIAFLFATLLLPMFSELEQDIDGREDLYYGSLNMIVGMSLVVAFPLVLYRDEIMNLLYHSTTTGSIASLAILMLAFIFKSSLFVTSTLLTSSQKFNSLMTLFGTSIALNFCANLIMIPWIGIEGASWATCISQFYIALGCLYLCHRKGLIRIRWMIYGRIMAFGGMITAVFLFLFYRSDLITGWWMLFTLTGLLGLLYVVINRHLIAQLSGRITRR